MVVSNACFPFSPRGLVRDDLTISLHVETLYRVSIYQREFDQSVLFFPQFAHREYARVTWVFHTNYKHLSEWDWLKTTLSWTRAYYITLATRYNTELNTTDLYGNPLLFNVISNHQESLQPRPFSWCTMTLLPAALRLSDSQSFLFVLCAAVSKAASGDVCKALVRWDAKLEV